MAKDKTKFYAVKDDGGGTIYTTWDECEKVVTGKSIDFKSFPTREQAQAYLDGVDFIYEKKVKPLLEEGWVVAYTDGSFDNVWKVYGYGVCIFTPDASEPVELCGTGKREEYLSTRNIAGEILGVINALKWVESHGYKKVLIYHDYEGVGKWADGIWHSKAQLANGYIDFVEKARAELNVRFMWVQGHASDTYNDDVDKLARRAIAEYRKGIEEREDPLLRIDEITEEDVLAVLARLIDDYPTIRYDVEEEKNPKEYNLTFGPDKLTVTMDRTGILVSGDKNEIIYNLFVTDAKKISDRKKAAKREEWLKSHGKSGKNNQ